MLIKADRFSYINYTDFAVSREILNFDPEEVNRLARAQMASQKRNAAKKLSLKQNLLEQSIDKKKLKVNLK